jgi:hypothetical protein
MADSILTVYRHQLYDKISKNAVDLILEFLQGDEFVIIEDDEDTYNSLLKTITNKSPIINKTVDDTHIQIFTDCNTGYIVIGKDKIGHFVLYNI